MLFRKLLFLVFMVIAGAQISAQVNCTKFADSPRGEEGLDAYSIYTQSMKSEEWKLALEQWEIAYKIAPAADGMRDHNFTKGVAILTHYHGKETDPAKKKALLERINKLYKDCATCYRQKAIAIQGCNEEKCIEEKVGHLMGDKGYNQYYHLRVPYSENLATFDQSVALTGDKTLYSVLAPYGSIAAYQYEKGLIEKEQAVAIYETLENIYKDSQKSEGEYKDYYEQAWKNVENAYNPIAGDLFDCEFFKARYKPQYDADPENPELIKLIIARLKGQECATTDPFLSELDRKWKTYAAVENAKIQAEFEANNPGVAAKRLYDEGDYEGSVDKYKVALEAEVDPEKQASYWFSISSIQFRKMNQYSVARESAYKAAKLRPNWGRPYMLIGDMYGSAARGCGDDWNQRMAILAAIDKYSAAKYMDSEVAEEASNKIGRYQAAKPDKTEGHMRGVKPGTKQKVGCWIGETVTVSYK